MSFSTQLQLHASENSPPRERAAAEHGKISSSRSTSSCSRSATPPRHGGSLTQISTTDTVTPRECTRWCGGSRENSCRTVTRTYVSSIASTELEAVRLRHRFCHGGFSTDPSGMFRHSSPTRGSSKANEHDNDDDDDDHEDEDYRDQTQRDRERRRQQQQRQSTIPQSNPRSSHHNHQSSRRRDPMHLPTVSLIMPCATVMDDEDGGFTESMEGKSGARDDDTTVARTTSPHCLVDGSRYTATAPYVSSSMPLLEMDMLADTVAQHQLEAEGVVPAPTVTEPIHLSSSTVLGGGCRGANTTPLTEVAAMTTTTTTTAATKASPSFLIDCNPSSSGAVGGEGCWCRSGLHPLYHLASSILSGAKPQSPTLQPRAYTQQQPHQGTLSGVSSSASTVRLLSSTSSVTCAPVGPVPPPSPPPAAQLLSPRTTAIERLCEAGLVNHGHLPTAKIYQRYASPREGRRHAPAPVAPSTVHPAYVQQEISPPPQQPLLQQDSSPSSTASVLRGRTAADLRGRQLLLSSSSSSSASSQQQQQKQEEEKRHQLAVSHLERYVESCSSSEGVRTPRLSTVEGHMRSSASKLAVPLARSLSICGTPPQMNHFPTADDPPTLPCVPLLVPHPVAGENTAPAVLRERRGRTTNGSVAYSRPPLSQQPFVAGGGGGPTAIGCNLGHDVDSTKVPDDATTATTTTVCPLTPHSQSLSLLSHSLTQEEIPIKVLERHLPHEGSVGSAGDGESAACYATKSILTSWPQPWQQQQQKQASTAATTAVMSAGQSRNTRVDNNAANHHQHHSSITRGTPSLSTWMGSPVGGRMLSLSPPASVHTRCGCEGGRGGDGGGWLPVSPRSPSLREYDEVAGTPDERGGNTQQQRGSDAGWWEYSNSNSNSNNEKSRINSSIHHVVQREGGAKSGGTGPAMMAIATSATSDAGMSYFASSFPPYTHFQRSSFATLNFMSASIPNWAIPPRSRSTSAEERTPSLITKSISLPAIQPPKKKS